PLPPSATLFPYTTLFRSNAGTGSSYAGTLRNDDIPRSGGRTSYRRHPSCTGSTAGQNHGWRLSLQHCARALEAHRRGCVGAGRSPSDCRRRSPVGDARSIVTVPDRQAIALRCDPEGIVERLLVDEIGASQHIGPGRSFVNAVDLSSKDEAHNVLSTIARELVAFDREIRLRGSDPGLAVILHVAGLAMPANRILVVGARSIVELIFLCRPPTGPSGPRAKTRSERIS